MAMVSKNGLIPNHFGVCWKRTLLACVTFVTVTLLLVHPPVFERRVDRLSSPCRTRHGASMQNLMKTLSNRRQDPRYPSKPVPSAKGKPFPKYDVTNRTIIKHYRCRFLDPWTATRSAPKPLALFSHLPALRNGSHNATELRNLEVLGYTLKENFKTDGAPRYVMIRRDSDCESMCQRRLHDSGWRICRVPDLPPGSHPNAAKDNSHAKLILWNTLQFQTIVFLQSNALTTGSLRDIVKTKVSPDNPMAALLMGDGDFDARVMVVRTNPVQFLNLFHHVEREQFACSTDSVLSSVFGASILRVDSRAVVLPPKGADRGQDTPPTPEMDQWLKAADSATEADYQSDWNSVRLSMCEQRCSSGACGLARLASCSCAKSCSNA